MDSQPARASGAAWEAEQAVPAPLAAELIGGQFPGLRGAPVELLATGWDNTVYLVDGQWAFRFPRRKVALPGLQHEIAALPRLARRLPLPVPVPELIGTPAGDFPWPFWGARLIRGTELAEADSAGPARSSVAAALGAFLRALHEPGLAGQDWVTGLGLPVDPMGRAEPRIRAAQASEPLARLAGQRAWSPDPAIDRLFDQAGRLGPAPQPPVLVHGDLHARHLLIGPAGTAAGVIDWGDLCLADPAVDLSLAYGGFAGPARAALLAAYGPVDAERELRARVLAVSLCASLADYALADGRERMLQESLAGLRRAVSG